MNTIVNVSRVADGAGNEFFSNPVTTIVRERPCRIAYCLRCVPVCCCVCNCCNCARHCCCRCAARFIPVWGEPVCLICTDEPQ